MEGVGHAVPVGWRHLTLTLSVDSQAEGGYEDGEGTKARLTLQADTERGKGRGPACPQAVQEWVWGRKGALVLILSS